MRIDVFFSDRVGIAQEVLAELARRSLNVTAVEVDPPHIFIEAPAVDQASLEELRGQLMSVSGVRSVEPVGMLPGAQRRLYLDTLLASQPDPIFAVDEAGRVVLANNAAIGACGMDETRLIGTPMQELIGNPELLRELVDGGYHLPVCEVVVNGEPYMLETMPLHEAGDRVAGAVMTLHAPSRMGERLSALQNYDAGGFDTILGNSAGIEQLNRAAAATPIASPEPK